MSDTCEYTTTVGQIRDALADHSEDTTVFLGYRGLYIQTDLSDDDWELILHGNPR